VTGELFAGRYRILGLVGVGGMGMVYRARDQQLDVDVAVKVLRPDIATAPAAQSRFRQELLSARQVSHRHVVRTHDLGQAGEVRFITMDFVAGRSLRDLIEGQGPLPPERAEAIFHQLAEALAAAHEVGIVHRDLKPSNVLIDEQGNAYITDFGIARSLGSGGLTAAGALVGTLEYLAPEQARGGPVDARTDIYTLGLLLYEMLSGKLPFRGGSDAEILAQRLHGPAQDITETGVVISPRLRAILRRCLERSPARRYSSAREILVDLASPRAPGRRRGLLYGTAAAALLAIVALVGYLAARRPGTPVAPDADSTPAAPLRSVVVLPLADQTGRSDLAWASAGVADMLSQALAEGSGLRVVDSARPRRAILDLGMAGRELGAPDLERLSAVLDADRVVSGTLRLAGERVRVDLGVSSPASATPALAVHADGAAGDLFAVVDRLGADLRRALAVAGAGDAAGPETRSIEALATRSAGRDHLQRGDPLGAVPLLERATAADAGYASAWLDLAEAYETLGYSEKSRAAALRAAQSAPNESSRLGYAVRARRALAEGEPENAVTILGQMLAAYPGDVEGRLLLAEAHGQVGDLDAALAALREVVAVDPNHPRGWYLLGKFTILAGDPRRAIDEALVHAMAVQNRLGSELGKAEVLNAIGVAHQRLGDLPAAEESYRQAAALRDRLGDRRGSANSLKNLGTLALVRGDVAAAQADFDRALAMAEEIGDRAGTAEILNAKGGLAEERGRYGEALELYRRALGLRRDLGDRLALAQSFGNVGYTYQALGEYDNAALYWNQALEAQVAAGDRVGVVASRQSLGQIEIAQGKWRSALKTFLETLEESRKLELPDAAAVSQGNLGRLAQLEGRYAAALTSYGEALTAVRELGDARGEIEFGLWEAETLAELGMTADAATRLSAVAALLEQADSDEQRAELLNLQGELALRRGAAGEASRHFAAALERAESSHAVVALLAARLGQARAKQRAGLREVEAVAQEASRVGHVRLVLRSQEALAEGRLAAAQPAAAAAAARAGLAVAAGRGDYARTFRLQLLLARGLAASGGAAEATAARAQARLEVERLRRDLTPGQRQAFDGLAEVRAAEEAGDV
jgi:tetratricopeptide (TPR) repeat protein/predicted Ser/Thr protein kinase